MPLEEFIALPDTISLMLRNSETLKKFVEERPHIKMGKVVFGDQVVIYVRGDKIEEVVREIGRNQVNMFSTVLGLLGMPELSASGISQVNENTVLNLRGNGTLIGIIDTGVEYTNNSFIYEDGTSKIDYIWDQTLNGNSPEGFYYGTEFTNEEINEALKSPNPNNIVPHTDDVRPWYFFSVYRCWKKKWRDYRCSTRCRFSCSKIKKSKTILFRLQSGARKPRKCI